MVQVLVTGGAGFIGSHLCEHILDQGDRVVAIDDFNDFYDPARKERNISGLLREPGFRLYRQDITDARVIENIFMVERPQKVVHLAARAGVRPSLQAPALYMRVNVEGTVNILEGSRKHGVKSLVFASSSSVYGTCERLPFREDDATGDMLSPYAITKRCGEMLCRLYHKLYGLDIACLRFFTVYGPRGRPDMAPYKFASKILSGEQIERFGDGSSTRDYTYVGDVVKGITAAMERSGFGIYNIGSDNPVSLNSLISEIEKQSGRLALIKMMPRQAGDVEATWADLSKSRADLGYSSFTGIDQGIASMLGWMEEEHAIPQDA